MRKLIFLACLLLLGSCGSVMTPEEQALVGDWKVVRETAVIPGLPGYDTTYTDFSVCHLLLTNEEVGNHTYKSIVGLHCNPNQGSWSLTGTILNVTGGWTTNILYLVGDSMVLRYYVNPTDITYYLKR